MDNTGLSPLLGDAHEYICEGADASIIFDAVEINSGYSYSVTTAGRRITSLGIPTLV